MWNSIKFPQVLKRFYDFSKCAAQNKLRLILPVCVNPLLIVFIQKGIVNYKCALYPDVQILFYRKQLKALLPRPLQAGAQMQKAAF